MSLLQNVILSDAMSEKSRRRAGGLFTIFSILTCIFEVVIMRLSPDSPLRSDVSIFVGCDSGLDYDLKLEKYVLG